MRFLSKIFCAALLLGVTTKSGVLPDQEYSSGLVVVDSTLVSELPLGELSPKSRLVVLDPGDSPFEVLENELQALQESTGQAVDFIDVFSHGSAGVLHLAGASVAESDLLINANAIRNLGHYLNPGADIRLYGCDLGSQREGKAFVETLATLTGADIAASNNLTGHADSGGDWGLEVTTGDIADNALITASLMNDYKGTLSHFRGGSVTWQAAELDNDGIKNDVLITVKTAWRYNSINSVTSLASVPSLTITQNSESTILIGPSGTDYALQTTILEARNLDFNTQYDVSYTGSARISALQNNSSGSWNIQSTIYLKDGNLAPKVDLPIIFEVPQLQQDGVTALDDWNYYVGTSDPNGDNLRYRMSNLTELGGGSSTNPVGLSINPITGLLTWSGSGSKTVGLYSGGIVAEDVALDGTVKSKTHVDFILDLQAKASVDVNTPVNIPKTHNVTVQKGDTFDFEIVGNAINTASLGSIQGALTEPTTNNYHFDPGVDGAGLLPATYPITFEIDDANGVQSKNYLTLNFIVADSDAPRISNIEADETVYSGGSLHFVDDQLDALVQDVNDPHFSGGTLKLSGSFSDGNYEKIVIHSVGDGTGQIRQTANEIFYEGQKFAEISAMEDGIGRSLRANFVSTAATPEAIQSLIHSLYYENTFTLRAAGERSFLVYLEDPNGLGSSYTFFVDVLADPSAPPSGGGPVEASNRLTVLEGSTVALSKQDINFADPDAGDTITLTVSNVTAGQFELVSNPGAAITVFTQDQVTLGQVAFAHDDTDNVPTFSVSASDGTNTATTPSAATVIFLGTNDQPSLTGTPTTTIVSGSNYSFTPTVVDTDAVDEYTFSILQKPSWATFSTSTGELSGTPAAVDAGTYSNIEISVVDSGALSASLAAFSINVQGDTDGDGVPDATEVSQGTDPNDANDSLDSDSDGVPDYIESQQSTDSNDANDVLDTDTDGVPDYVETQESTDPNDSNDVLDSDNDGVPDHVEGLQSTDANDANDTLDSDGDGVPDYVEANQSTDANDANDVLDSDGDGVPDYVETRQATDPNDANDALDSDNDGVPDHIEGLQSTDPNDVSDALDSDNDGVPDYIETNQSTDANDANDVLDGDGDGVPDYVEVQQSTDANDANDALDSDNDGVPDYIEGLQSTDANDANDTLDSDNDGVPDYIEDNQSTDANDANDVLDSDGDGVPDYVEAKQSTDPNDANDSLDSDNDGVPDYIEELQSTDVNDANDVLDGDNDGVPDYVETQQSTDPNDVNDALDSDNDGVPDYIETKQSTDPNDAYDVLDTDGDEVPDYIEARQSTDINDASDLLDSDNDGVPDFTEGQQSTDPNDPNDSLDSDGDQVPDYIESQQSTDINDSDDSLDTDGDGVPDYIEQRQSTDENDRNDLLDGDNDGVPDYTESREGTDENDPNDLLDTDNDGVPDYTETQQSTDPYDPADALDSDNDGVPDFVEENQGTDASDPDDAPDGDNDGIPDYVEEQQSTDPADPGDSLDTDGDGVPDFIETQDGTDPNDNEDYDRHFGSVFGAVNATGLRTKVTHAQLEAMGVVEASDKENCCGDYLVSDIDGEPLFPPGLNVIEWADTVFGILDVHPLVSLGIDGEISEGETHSFHIWLNGLAPEYPLTIPYTVHGSANAADHSLVGGEVTFNRGETRASVTFNVLDDGIPDGGETIVVELDANLVNASEQRVQTFIIKEEANRSPQVELQVVQGLRVGAIVEKSIDLVEVSAIVTDPDVTDTHQVEWSVSDRLGNLVVVSDQNIDENIFSFDTSELNSGLYKFTAMATDDGSSPMAHQRSVYIQLLDSLPVLGSIDTDKDGVSDIIEGISDSDGDGVLDYQDPKNAGNTLPQKVESTDAYLIECEFSVTCRTGLYTTKVPATGSEIDLETLQEETGLSIDEDYENTGGLFDVEAELPLLGQLINIVFPQKAQLPEDAVYRSLDSNMQWQEFQLTGTDVIRSAAGEPGQCPPPGDDQWQLGLAEGHWCVQISILDGGFNDADAQINGVVQHTGGVSLLILDEIEQPPESSALALEIKGAGGGRVSPYGLLVLLCLLLWRARVAYLHSGPQRVRLRASNRPNQRC